MAGIKKFSEPGCYDGDFEQRVKAIFPPDDQYVRDALEDGSECVSYLLREARSLDGTFVKQCLDDPKRLDELRVAANNAATAHDLLSEWGGKYRHIFWED